MENNLIAFENPEFGEIRTMIIDGDPWFVGKDVADALGYEKPRNAIAMHVDDDDSLKWGVTDSLGREQETTIINESGLYSLILSSKLPTAKSFKHWVTSEVLPSIRKTGAYFVPSVKNEHDLILIDHLNDMINRLDDSLTAMSNEISNVMQHVSYNNYYLRLQMRSGYNEQWIKLASKKIDAISKHISWSHKDILREIYNIMKCEYGYDLNLFCNDYRKIKDVRHCSTLSVISYSEQLRQTFDKIIDDALSDCGITIDSTGHYVSPLLTAIHDKRIEEESCVM